MSDLSKSRPGLTRRDALLSFGASAGAAAFARPATAETAPIKVGALVALTGFYGPNSTPSAKALRAVVDDINSAGGVLGRPIALYIEDEQSNPEAGVRAARQLIDVRDVHAICATGASNVTMAVAPLCWQAKIPLFTVAGADAVTRLPHEGYIFRTQPNTTFQARRMGQYIVETGARRVAFLSAQTPFASNLADVLSGIVTPAGGQVLPIIYDANKTSYRSEVDQALAFTPDLVVMAGYIPDTSLVLKDLYRAGFDKPKVAFGFAFNQTLVDGLPHAVSEGIVSIGPTAAVGSKGYERVQHYLGTASPDPYSCQAYDHISLLAITAAVLGGDPTGTAIRDTLRKATKAPGGTSVDNPRDGIRLAAAGMAVDYDGASGPCRFDERGDIVDAQFRYEQVKDGRLTLLRIG